MLVAARARHRPRGQTPPNPIDDPAGGVARRFPGTGRSGRGGCSDGKHGAEAREGRPCMALTTPRRARAHPSSQTLHCGQRVGRPVAVHPGLAEPLRARALAGFGSFGGVPLLLNVADRLHPPRNRPSQPIQAVRSLAEHAMTADPCRGPAAALVMAARGFCEAVWTRAAAAFRQKPAAPKDGQRWPPACASHAEPSQITEPGWSTELASVSTPDQPCAFRP